MMSEGKILLYQNIPIDDMKMTLLVKFQCYVNFN